MCNSISFASITSVKVIGSPIGGRPDPSKPLIDADNDGKCQEENGKWIPCPPGIGTGSVVNAAGEAVGKIQQAATQPRTIDDVVADRRQKFRERAAQILNAARQVISKSKSDKYQQRPISAVAGDIGRWLSNYSKRNPIPPQDSAPIRELVRYRNNLDLDFKGTQLGAEVYDWVDEMFSHSFTAKNGEQYTSKVSDVGFVEIANRDPGILLKGVIRDSNNRKVGEFVRTLRFDGTVIHNSLDIKEPNQKDGIGTAFNAANEILYRDAGFKEVRADGLSDATHIGASHWPKNGFDWLDNNQREIFLDVIDEAIQAYDKDPDSNSWMFDNREQLAELKRLMNRANREAMGDADRLEPYQMLFWPGAERWFQEVDSTGIILRYRKPL